MMEILKVINKLVDLILNKYLMLTSLVISGSNINFKEEILAFGLKVSLYTSRAYTGSK